MTEKKRAAAKPRKKKKKDESKAEAKPALGSNPLDALRDPGGLKAKAVAEMAASTVENSKPKSEPIVIPISEGSSLRHDRFVRDHSDPVCVGCDGVQRARVVLDDEWMVCGDCWRKASVDTKLRLLSL